MQINFKSANLIQSTSSVSARCPSCRQIGVFTPINNLADVFIALNELEPKRQPTKDFSGYILSQRQCPNRNCSAHLFCIFQTPSGKIEKTYPTERLDFNSSNIPERIRKTFEEAIICHAEECYVAAAIMVRRTLEELCDDKAAKGKDLLTRIEALKTVVVLPQELFAAMHDLRLLGNDAAHIEAKTFDSLGETEVETAIEITKEILKSVYQLDSLIARMKALKKA